MAGFTIVIKKPKSVSPPRVPVTSILKTILVTPYSVTPFVNDLTFISILGNE